MAHRILITGFDPFGDEKTNPSWESVRALPEQPGISLEKLLLPTAYLRAPALLTRAIADIRPAAVISVGQAGGASGLRLERVAINLCGSGTDNDGVCPKDQPVVSGAPDGYLTRLPIDALQTAVAQQGIPCRVSLSAGTFLCNCVYYHALHAAATTQPGMQALFVHVPYLPEQAASKNDAPSMALEGIVQGLQIIVAHVNSLVSQASNRG